MNSLNPLLVFLAPQRSFHIKNSEDPFKYVVKFSNSKLGS